MSMQAIRFVELHPVDAEAVINQFRDRRRSRKKSWTLILWSEFKRGHRSDAKTQEHIRCFLTGCRDLIRGLNGVTSDQAPEAAISSFGVVFVAWFEQKQASLATAVRGLRALAHEQPWCVAEDIRTAIGADGCGAFKALQWARSGRTIVEPDLWAEVQALLCGEEAHDFEPVRLESLDNSLDKQMRGYLDCKRIQLQETQEIASAELPQRVQLVV